MRKKRRVSLTNKAATYAQDIGPGCQFWMPFLEGSGDTFTDLANGMVATCASVDHTDTAHAAKVFRDFVVPNSGTVPTLPAGKHLIICCARKINGARGFNAFAFGENTTRVDMDGGFGMWLNGKNDGVSSETTLFTGTPSTGDKEIVLGTWNGVNGELNSWVSVNGAGAAKDTTVDGSFMVGNDFAFEQTIEFATGPFPTPFYGAFMYYVSELPSDAEIAAACERMYASWTKGRKLIDPLFTELKA